MQQEKVKKISNNCHRFLCFYLRILQKIWILDMNTRYENILYLFFSVD